MADEAYYLSADSQKLYKFAVLDPIRQNEMRIVGTAVVCNKDS